MLITKDGHIKLADFGTALKYVEGNCSTEYIGTALYVSPEILDPDSLEGVNKYSPACDMWALGCIIYQMLTGISPFYADTEYLIYENINGYIDQKRPINFPSSVQGISKQLVEALLKKSPSERLTAWSQELTVARSIKNHEFFKNMPWTKIPTMKPPYIPNPSDLPDTNNMKDGEFDEWIFEGDATMIYDNLVLFDDYKTNIKMV